MVRDELKELGFSKDEIDGGGLRVTTTFDEQAQEAAQTAGTEGFPPPPNDGVKMGMVSIDPRSGAVVAIYGGKNWEKNQFNNATATVPVGSTMKAFTVAAALRNGYTLSSTFNGNSPFYVDGVTEGFENQGGQSYGSAVTLETATEQSINTAFLDLTQQMGPQEVADAARDAGLDTKNLDVEPADHPGVGCLLTAGDGQRVRHLRERGRPDRAVHRAAGHRRRRQRPLRGRGREPSRLPG